MPPGQCESVRAGAGHRTTHNQGGTVEVVGMGGGRCFYTHGEAFELEDESEVEMEILLGVPRPIARIFITVIRPGRWALNT